MKLDEVHTRYLEFRSLRSSELSCTKDTGKSWIHQRFFANVSKSLLRQTFLPPKFITIQYNVRKLLNLFILIICIQNFHTLIVLQ